MYILAKKEYIKCGFEIIIKLEEGQEGWSQFADKWVLDGNGPVIGIDGQRWKCDWYSIGKIEEGNGMTVRQARMEFKSDCERFDTYLTINVLKNGIPLVNEYIVTGDYSFLDNRSEDQAISDLITNCLNDMEYIEQANGILKSLLD